MRTSLRVMVQKYLHVKKIARADPRMMRQKNFLHCKAEKNRYKFFRFLVLSTFPEAWNVIDVVGAISLQS
jgi:hypothetical protein